jgi:predicted CXXCH cytochrome family protein
MVRMELLTKSASLIAALLISMPAVGAVREPPVQNLASGREVMPNSSKECAICHIRWVQAFDRTKLQKDQMNDVLERQAGSGDMCLSCHDGSVTDSRFKVWSTRHHTTDSVPPASVKIPTETFPLDEKGRMTCATCHTAHAVPDSSDLKTVIFLRRPNIDSSFCLACHPEHAQKSDIQHPLGQVDYPIPQEILDAGGETAVDGHTVICQTCHEPHGARNAWMLVLPPSKLCIACHTEKSPETNPPAGAPVHHIGRVYSGFVPPKTLLDEKAIFGPNGELSCLSCHRLHDASGAKPLLIRKNEDSSLCLDCHKKEKAVLDSPHDLRFSSPETVNAAGLTASESGPCGACHRIHGWARDVPETNRPHSSGCMECHQAGGPGSFNRPYVDAHTVGKPVPDDMPVVLPLDKDTNSIGCLTCHDPHSPRVASLQPAIRGRDSLDTIVLGDEVGTGIQAPRSFLRYEGSQLCVLCHVKLTDLPGQPHDPATFGPTVRNTLALNPSIGSCRVCHTTHSAQGPHLWAWPPATGQDGQAHDAGQITDLCGSCHRDKMGIQNSVHDPQTNEWAQKLGYVSKGSCLDCHPVHDPNDEGGIWTYVKNEGDTSWSCETCHRDGGPGKAKGMETAHMGKSVTTKMINQPKNMMLTFDGRITCATCHDIHQNEKDTKLLVAPIDELCGTCHEDKLGIRDSKHDPGTADWAKDLGFVSKGSCIDCHPPHGPKNKDGIWAAVIKDQSAPAQSCETCHWTGGPGKAMETAHMGLTLTNDPKNLPENMVVDPNMRILCVTCHDIHQRQQGPMLLATPRGDSGICIVCHPETGGLIGTAHDLRTSAPDAFNLSNETAAESGPCGVCHKVHGTSGYAGVWAQSSISEGDLPSAYCTCCHSRGKCAARLIPKYSDHPDVALVNRTHPGEPGYVPTFDGQGEPSRTGAISCLTCHEPHTVLPNSGEISAVRRPLRENHNTFLRPMTYQKLCVDCHGAETLWRFLYYHKENRNPYPEHSSSLQPALKE